MSTFTRPEQIEFVDKQGKTTPDDNKFMPWADRV